MFSCLKSATCFVIGVNIYNFLNFRIMIFCVFNIIKQGKSRDDSWCDQGEGHLMSYDILS